MPRNIPFYTDQIPSLKEPFSITDIGNTAPQYHRLFNHSQFNISLVFFQMGETVELGAKDHGLYSQEKAIEFLKRRGFQLRPSPITEIAHFSKDDVRVKVIGPSVCRERGPREKCLERINQAFRESDLLYINGHRESVFRLFEKMAPYPPAYKIVFLDICWSCQYYLSRFFTGANRYFEIVCTLNETITGSVYSFLRALDLLLNAKAAFPSGESQSFSVWKKILGEMNQVAKIRARHRQEDYPRLKPVEKNSEVYGVVPLLSSIRKTF